MVCKPPNITGYSKQCLNTVTEAYLSEVGHKGVGLGEWLKFGKCENSVTGLGSFKLLWFRKIDMNVIWADGINMGPHEFK